MPGLRIVKAPPSREEKAKQERESVEASLLLRQGCGAFGEVAGALLESRNAMAEEIERHERGGKRGAYYCLWCAEDGHGTPTDWPCPTVEKLQPALWAIERVLPRSAHADAPKEK
jgi:hypothetical protein